MKHTKESLENRGREYCGTFGFTSELWTKKGDILLVDMNTRKIIVYVKGKDEKK